MTAWSHAYEREQRFDASNLFFSLWKTVLWLGHTEQKRVKLDENEQRVFAYVAMATDIVFQETRRLRCPETLFISHEHANFLFSVFRVVQDEAKTLKIMGCCGASFAFLHALKIGILRKKWTLEWVFKTSLQNLCRLALYFFNQQQTCFFFPCFATMTNGNFKKTFDLECRTV